MGGTRDPPPARHVRRPDAGRPGVHTRRGAGRPADVRGLRRAAAADRKGRCRRSSSGCGSASVRSDVGFRTGQPSRGRPRWPGGSRSPTSEPIDAIALLLAADAFPPAVFNTDLPVAWVPTVELTVHVRGVPAPGPLRCEFRTRFVHDGLLDEEGAIWDSSGVARRPEPPARPRRPLPRLTSERRQPEHRVSGGGTIGRCASGGDGGAGGEAGARDADRGRPTRPCGGSPTSCAG